MVHGLQFLKLYFIHCYDNNVDLPKIDKPFVNAVFKILCEKTTSGRPPSERTQELKAKLTQFYEDHYKELITADEDKMNYQNLNTVLDYLAIEVLTMYENNIKQHFCEYVGRYVNVMYEKKNQIKQIKDNVSLTTEEKKKASMAVYTQLRKIKNDLLNPHEEKKSNQEFHTWIDESSGRKEIQNVQRFPTAQQFSSKQLQA
jgi:hypothetical protein